MLAIDPTGPEVERVERAIRYLACNRLEQPRLEEVADVMGLSPFHAQRVFSSIVGVSPKQFLGLLTVEHAKALLRDAESVLGAALEVGLSGPSRLHDLFVKIEAITPGEYRAEGRGLTMRWGIHATPFGEALFVVSERGLARLAFLADAGPDGALAEAQADWPLSTFVEDGRATALYAKRAFRNLTGEALPAPFRVLVKGSPFQIQGNWMNDCKFVGASRFWLVGLPFGEAHGPSRQYVPARPFRRLGGPSPDGQGALSLAGNPPSPARRHPGRR